MYFVVPISFEIPANLSVVNQTPFITPKLIVLQMEDIVLGRLHQDVQWWGEEEERALHTEVWERGGVFRRPLPLYRSYAGRH